MQSLSTVVSILATSSLKSANQLSQYSSLLTIVALLLSLVSGLQQSLGKSFASTSLHVLQSSVAFSTQPHSAYLLTGSSGLHVVQQMLILAKTVATSSSTLTVTVVTQVSLTHDLLQFVCSHFNEPQVCAELLEDAINVGKVAIDSYWNQKVTQLSTGHNDEALEAHTEAVKQSHVPVCQPIALVLTTLFVGSLDANIPPQDAQTAIEGINHLVEMHNILSVNWFQVSGCWLKVLQGCLQSLLFVSHPQLRQSVLDVLQKLRDSDLQKTTEVTLQLGFWSVVGSETFRMATGAGVGPQALSVLNAVYAAHGGNGQTLTIPAFNSLVVEIIAAEIAKLKTT